MSVNKKSISSQALLEMNEIKKAIKEESKNTIKAMLSEAVKDALRESVEDDDDMEILDGDEKECCPKCGKCGDECECGKKDAEGKEDKESDDKKDSGEIDEVGAEDEVPAEGESSQDPAMNAPEQAPAEAPAEGEGAEGQDDFMAQYQAGDEDTLDLTGEQDIQNVLKVYRALSDEDQVVVKKDGDKISLQDNGTGAEYIIDLGTDEAETPAEPAMDNGEAQLAEELSSAADNYNELSESDEENEDEMKNDTETLFEIDLGYTDNYQDKDPIDGLSNSEPSKSGRSWHKGIPTGTEKPWAGKGTEKKGDPFDKSVNENLTELDDNYFAAGLNDTGVAEVETEDGMPFDKKVGDKVDENFTTSKYQKRHEVKTKATNSGEEKNPMQTRNTSIGNEYNAEINETIKKLKAKNKKLNEAVKELHKGLQEAYMTNVNLGKITKLFLENTTTQAEKLNIVERFSNEAKTPKQAQALYESISKQLANNKTTIDESKATEKTVVTESKAPVYKSQDLLNTIDLMNRVLNC